MPNKKKTTEDRLECALENAQETLRSVQDESQEKRRKAIAEYIDNVLAPSLEQEFGARIERAATAYTQAKLALQNHLVEKALAGGSYKHPIGTKMMLWKPEYAGGGRYNKKCTGTSGIVEVITAGSVHPKNLNCGKANIGDVVIRICNKDGTPGMAYATGYRRDNWFREGVDPNKVKS